MPPTAHPFFSGPGGRFGREKVLMVEGQDDAYFFDSLLTSINADPTVVGINWMGGNDIDTELGVLVKKREYVNRTIKKLAFILDADEDYQSTCNKVQTALAKHQLPATAPNAFFCCCDNTINVGYTLLPSPVENGDLELVCLRTVGNDFKLRWIKRLLSRIEKHTSKYDHINKRHAMMYLACIHRNDTRGVGKSFADGVFDKNHDSLASIINFINLFVA